MNNDIVKDKSMSTRSMILEKSLELINEIGMVDFKIDLLAQSLNLSPGNITYHFSKKEDICTTLWGEFMIKAKVTKFALSKMLDIKQTYLILRAISRDLYDYRGVVMFRGGDLRVIQNDESDSNTSYTFFMSEIMLKLEELLRNNGYVAENKFSEYKEYFSYNYSQLTRFGLNLDILMSAKEKKTAEEVVDKNALMMLYSFYSILTDKGIKEFRNIAEIVNKKEMSIKM